MISDWFLNLLAKDDVTTALIFLLMRALKTHVLRGMPPFLVV